MQAGGVPESTFFKVGNKTFNSKAIRPPNAVPQYTPIILRTTLDRKNDAPYRDRGAGSARRDMPNRLMMLPRFWNSCSVSKQYSAPKRMHSREKRVYG